MNGLSLRISAIKTNENLKKNCELRMDLLTVPSTLLSCNDNNKYISGLASATTVDDQIKTLKQYFSYTTEMEKSLLQNIQILSDLFMEAPTKHAVKNTIMKYLSQVVLAREIVVLGMSNTIKDKIISFDNNKSTLANRNTIINSIGNCFENCKVGIEVVRSCLQDILCFLNKTLMIYSEHLSHNISPSDKSEICVFIHTTIRVVISCFNQFPSILTTSYEGEKNVEKVVLICWDLLENPEIPMDTKMNCGILITMNANLEKRYLRLTERIFTEENSTKKLCLLNGVICTIESELFGPPDFRGFNILTIAANVLKQISEENYIEPSIVLGVTRSFFQMTKRLLSLKFSEHMKSDHIEITEILALNLGYSLSHIEHYLDSVRHMSKDLLKVTIQLGMKVNGKLNHIIYDYIQNENTNITTKCILISSICSIVKSNAVLRAVPNLNEFLLESLTDNDHANINLYINNCYETLMMTYSYEDNKKEWFDKWIVPILAGLERNKNDGDVKNTLFDLIRKAIKSYPEISIKMIDSVASINFGLILSSLGIAKKCGLFDKIESNSMKWKNLIQYRDIKHAMVSADDATRLSALHLLTECHKSTELFTKEDLECILFFVETNVNVQSPAIRQKITCCMKNALNRIKSGFLSIIKKSDMDGKSHYYYDFVKTLHNFCLFCLCGGANFSRRTISFQILIQLLQVASYIFHEDENCSMWNEQQVVFLIDSLSDSYEANKVYCLGVLLYCPKFYLKKCDHLINYQITEIMMTSIRPHDCLTAAYYLEYLCFINMCIETPMISDESIISPVQSKVYCALLWCMKILTDGLNIAKGSLLRAARENPMFGALGCIRHLLNKIDFKEVSSCDHWVKFISNLIIICCEITKIVSVVVNNSSPEGHLPNDFSPIENYEFDEDIEMSSLGSNVNGGSNNAETTPQMLLLCSWRTVKEISLILGDVASKSPITYQKWPPEMVVDTIPTRPCGLITCEQVIQIGSHFIELLAETKHRGAFEQAYVGFTKLCIRLWGSKHTALHQLPMKWLNEIISVITSDHDGSDIKTEKMCSTRRSAGIPYMMQALISSELHVSSSKGLQFSTKKLIEICSVSTKADTRTHCLNILRALFRSTDLGDSIGEFVSDGIVCAINGYGAESWSERNSSTLLFSALMIRVFGVLRSKDYENLNIRNKMTGRIFFLRYPQLYDFFMKELEIASQIISKGARSKKLHPLLLLLSRLYPSALEGSESNLKLSRFVPIISVCSGCAELQTRYLAAKFIAIIVSPDLIFDRIFLLLESLHRSNNKAMNPNSVHGALLQILFLVRTRNLDAPESSNQLNNWIELYTAISNYLFEVHTNFILYSTIIDILIEILVRCQNVIFMEDDQFLDDLHNIVDYLCNLSKQWLFYGREATMRKIVLIKLTMYIYADDDKLPSDCFLCCIDPAKYSYEYVESIMNLVMLILNYEDTSCNAEQFELDPVEMLYVKSLKTCRKDKFKPLQDEFTKSFSFHNQLRLIISQNIQNSCTVKAYTILSYSINGLEVLLSNNKSRENIDKMLELANDKPDQLRASIYRCIKCLYQTESIVTKNAPKIEILPLMASSLQCQSIRIIALDILSIVSKYFGKCRCFAFYLNFSKTILMLLRDDDSDVRSAATRIITDMLNGMEKIKTDLLGIR
uniref:tRNA (32-2'-O)-methyltransferase regulator THADA n=1 Tax=Culex pipiens TaxID=7175 RepID=A0A8D8I1B9_CULPI